MTQQHFQNQQQGLLFNQSAGPITDFNILTVNNNSQQEEVEVTKSPKSRLDNTNHHYGRLYKVTFIPRSGQRDATRTGGRKNRNEILSLTLTRFIKEKHLNGLKYSRDMELLRGIQMKSNNADFVMVLRTDGRMVAMSDEAEHHLGKSMRLLYAQCINILQCLDESDRSKLQEILNSSADLTHQEHRLVCTLRLPKGKRPSRDREDIKTIIMAGHFYSCQHSSSHERLFIARCETLLSRITTNGSSSSQGSMMTTNNNDNTNSMIQIKLNEDMSINFVSSNVKDILGYSKAEMTNNWLGRYLATNDLEKFETIRQKYFEHEGQQQQAPTSVCDIFDMYANNGDGRLTFLCQIRPIRERRSKSIKFSLVAQLIDPSLRSEYVQYVNSESEPNPKSIKAEQYHHQYRRRAKTQSWPIARPSSTWASSSSLTPLGTTSSITSNIHHFTDHSQMLPRSTSMINLGDNYLISNMINFPQQQGMNTSQQNSPIMPTSNINPTRD